MNVGTKSLLFGVHQVFIHPFWVALAWWKLYGFPWDPRLWVAFVVHDWGYWGCPEMDGPKGDLHPYRGAEIMHFLFDTPRWSKGSVYIEGSMFYWRHFCLYHSRFLAKQHDQQPSKLCMADKLAMYYEPWWLYLPRAWASGELKEYVNSCAPGGKNAHMNLVNPTARQWYKAVQGYLKRYAEEHKDGKIDAVTKLHGGLQ